MHPGSLPLNALPALSQRCSSSLELQNLRTMFRSLQEEPEGSSSICFFGSSMFQRYFRKAVKYSKFKLPCLSLEIIAYFVLKGNGSFVKGNKPTNSVKLPSAKENCGKVFQPTHYTWIVLKTQPPVTRSPTGPIRGLDKQQSRS